MKPLLGLLVLLTLLTTAANAQPPYLYQFNNEIGIYLIENPTAENAQDMACYIGPPGAFTAYVVVTNPYNDGLDQPIDMVGGFEFRLVFPPGLFIMAILPPHLTLYTIPPDYQCGGDIPVQGGANERRVVLMALNISTFAPDPAAIFIGPLAGIPPTVPGFAVIADAGDNYNVFTLNPVSGSYDAPVFGLYDCGNVVPNEDVSWGAVKTLYR
jgi:hypothetical protein